MAKVIQAQQAALTAQIEALQVAPGTQVEGPWAETAWPRVPRPSAPASTWPRSAAPVTDPGPARGVGPVAGSGPGDWAAQGHWAARRPGGTGRPGRRSRPGGLAVPVGRHARGTSRRGLLIGAGAGSLAVIGGTVGWALSSRSAGGTPSTGTGDASLPTGQGLPTGGSLQQYYGAGTRRTAAWKFPTGNAIEANSGAGGGLVCVASTDNNVYAVNIATRRQAWTFAAGAVTAAPEVVGNVVCLSTSAGHFYALRVADGTRAWDVDASVPATYKRTWAVDGGNVILGTDTTSPQAYDAATGTKGVRYSTQEPYVMALSAAGGILYAVDAFGMLYAFHSATGTEIWHKQLLSSDDLPGTGLTIDSGSIYVGTMSGALYKIDAASGQVLWTYHPGSGMESNVVVADGVVYLRDNNGTVHAINAANKQAAMGEDGHRHRDIRPGGGGRPGLLHHRPRPAGARRQVGRSGMGLHRAEQRRAPRHPGGRQRARLHRLLRRRAVRSPGMTSREGC